MLGYKSPNEKLSIVGAGAGNQALADVDERRAVQGYATWERATHYRDFRKMPDHDCHPGSQSRICAPRLHGARETRLR
jgi:hypothetical protein